MRSTLMLCGLLVLAGCGAAPESDEARDDARESELSLTELKTDSGTYPFHRSSAPPVARNGTFVDEQFGTTILRATDSSDGNACTTSYSYWPTFNMDNTRMLVICDNRPWVINFDPYRLQMTTGTYSATPNFTIGQLTDLLWSSVSPSTFYWHNGTKLASHDVNTDSVDTVKTFDGIFDGQSIYQMSKSEDDSTFAFSRKSDSTGKLQGYVVWNRSRGIRLNSCWSYDSANGECYLDEVHIDKTGRYLVISTGLSTLNKPG